MNRRDHASSSLNLVTLQATLHCLAGCAIGEVLGMMLGSALGWPNGLTVVVSVILAFASGFALTMRPLLGAGLRPRQALGLALAADTASIALMEVVDNALMLAIPGAMDAHLGSPLFWGSMALSLALAGVAAFPLNRWLIARGQGHAVVHAMHEGHAPNAEHGSHDGQGNAPDASGHAGHGDGHSPGHSGH
jgi:hypothetical protein